MQYDRVVLVVLDSVGCGAAHDANRFGDENSNTLKNIGDWCVNNQKYYSLPNLSTYGLIDIVDTYGTSRFAKIKGSRAILEELSPGKDTTTGHWEIAGNVLTQEFPSYPQGFPLDLLNEWAQENSLPGFLCNQASSGTTVLPQFGLEHIQSGKPIVYTSADSVWQIAAHEEHFGLEKLLKICASARKYADRLGLGRVIARPFVGDTPANFKRSLNRKDFSQPPPSPNLLDVLVKDGLFVASVGKIDDIFAHRSITLNHHTANNESTLPATLQALQETTGKRGLIFSNFIDFDQLYGHRRDPLGYAHCLMSFDNVLPTIEAALGPKDLLLITADHGNDPTQPGTDHTREKVPLLAWSPNPAFRAENWGEHKGFTHIARLVIDALGLTHTLSELPDAAKAKSFLG